MDIKNYIESGIIESYVLGLTTAEESVEVQALAQQHVEVKNAILDFENLFENELNKNVLQPPAHIKSNLTNILFVDSSTGTKPEEANIKLAPVRNINISRYIAAAAIILLVISTSLNFYFYSAFKSSTDKYEALLIERNTLQVNNASYKTRLDEINQSLQMIEDPHMKKIPMEGVKGKENNIATIYWDTRNKEVYVLSNKLEKAPEGKQYQLWAIIDGKPVDAGLVGYDCAGLCKMKVINRADAFAITLEKAGGSKAPTLSQMFVMGKVS